MCSRAPSAAALLLLLAACSPEPAETATPAATAQVAPPSRPDILVVSVDTLRADRLSTWGYGRPTSPTLDQLAATSLRFEDAVAPAPWTLPSMASLFTGVMPTQHGVNRRQMQLPASAQTLAERVSAAGYETAFFGVNAAFVTGHGLDQGFATWSPHVGLSGRALNEMVQAFLDARTDPRPLFLFVHYMEPHCRYNPPKDVRDRFLPDPTDHTPVPLALETYSAMGDCFKLQTADGEPELDREIYRARYDAEVLEVDGLLAALWQAVAPREPWLAFVADHGEAFWEHGTHGHGSQLYREQIHVPLMVRPPGGQAPETVAGATSTLWLHDAVVAVATGQPTPTPSTVALSETDYDGQHLRAAVQGAQKLILDQETGASMCFDLATDPGEQRPLVQCPGELEVAVREGFGQAGQAEPLGAPLGEGERELLEGLGYVE